MEEAAKEARRQWEREYYRKNRKKILARKKLNRELNHKDALEKERTYRQNNRDKIKTWNTNYWKRRAEREATQQKKVD